MKRLTILFAVIFLSLTAICQELNNPVYFRFGYSDPSWNYFGQGKDYWAKGISKFGGNFEVGTIFLIQRLTPAKNMAIGIDATYLYANFNDFYMGEKPEDVNLGIYRVGTKLGPSFTYSPIDKMAFDVYVKADVAWAAVVAPYEKKIDDGDDYYLDYLPVGLSTGLNFRYGLLMLGVEYNTISPQLESDDNKGTYLQDGINELNGIKNGSKKSKMQNLNFTIGMCF
ncbi:MAG TPA: hypothetical protein DCL77_18640 [Prolixibacteraceae bacterium]|jgi:hypothetical protein|nr:hypothetical protein [Prolixibacteraceae bacterium]